MRRRPRTPFPHFWEQIFGSGRAILSLRDSYRRDLRTMKTATDIHYVRFHAIFHDEVGVYDEDSRSEPVYNWSYVDQIYDGLLDEWSPPVRRVEFYAAQAGRFARAARILVQTFAFAPEKLRQMGGANL